MKSHFTANGHLSSVTDELSTVTYWQATTVNAEGQVTAETLGNGVATARVYDPATSRIDSIVTTKGATGIQDLAFDFDTLGNLTARRDLRQDREEAFTYDGLNRLTGTTLTDTATLATLATTAYRYDNLGNIVTKSDVAGGSNYVYGLAGAGPHAVSQIGAKLYSYDLNGAMVSGDGKTTAWTSFNKPEQITDTLAGDLTSFVYGPSRARVKQQIVDGGLSTTVIYVGSHFEKKVRPGEDDELVHYIRAGGSVVAIRTTYSDVGTLSDKTRYLHRDHLGSVAAVTDEAGAVTERFSYDPHGKRRLTDWQAGTPAAAAETPRGFTGHEHLDAVGLIHMNGRVYDPTLGRFLSADPFVTYPETTQGFNRYSYVNNNPLSYTDPSGFEGYAAERTDNSLGGKGWEGEIGHALDGFNDWANDQLNGLEDYFGISIDAPGRLSAAEVQGIVDGLNGLPETVRNDPNAVRDLVEGFVNSTTGRVSDIDRIVERYSRGQMGIDLPDFANTPGYERGLEAAGTVVDTVYDVMNQITRQNLQLNQIAASLGGGARQKVAEVVKAAVRAGFYAAWGFNILGGVVGVDLDFDILSKQVNLVTLESTLHSGIVIEVTFAYFITSRMSFWERNVTLTPYNRANYNRAWNLYDTPSTHTFEPITLQSPFSSNTRMPLGSGAKIGLLAGIEYEIDPFTPVIKEAFGIKGAY
ncbi:RHS repeat-associated core domain-containing protein [Pelagibius sp. CAU 1746]|uniref:RHS repeat-associated core domain-containing protein n=1 Tax=Pelagibius sp. CAU 1746 TaxID=3140370 RepID=UPI00325AE441